MWSQQVDMWSYLARRSPSRVNGNCNYHQQPTGGETWWWTCAGCPWLIMYILQDKTVKVKVTKSRNMLLWRPGNETFHTLLTLSFLARTSCSMNGRVDGYWRHHDIPISRCNVTGVSVSDTVVTPINCRVNRLNNKSELWGIHNPDMANVISGFTFGFKTCQMMKLDIFREQRELKCGCRIVIYVSNVSKGIHS